MSTIQAIRDPWLDQVRLSPTQWFELVTGRKSVPFPTTPDMPTFQVLSRKESPMPAGLDLTDPVCPDCKQYPLVRKDLLHGNLFLWCNGCGLGVDVQCEAGLPERVQILRPTNPAHKPGDLM
jgi:hypothetical protein